MCESEQGERETNMQEQTNGMSNNGARINQARVNNVPARTQDESEQCEKVTNG